jgi:hypothetical protein
MIQTCPNCEQWLALVSGHWVHLNTTEAHACWTKHEVEAGIPYIAPVIPENPEVEVEDWIAAAFGTPVEETPSDTCNVCGEMGTDFTDEKWWCPTHRDTPVEDNSDLFALLG